MADHMYTLVLLYFMFYCLVTRCLVRYHHSVDCHLLKNMDFCSIIRVCKKVPNVERMQVCNIFQGPRSFDICMPIPPNGILHLFITGVSSCFYAIIGVTGLDSLYPSVNWHNIGFQLSVMLTLCQLQVHHGFSTVGQYIYLFIETLYSVNK